MLKPEDGDAAEKKKRLTRASASLTPSSPSRDRKKSTTSSTSTKNEGETLETDKRATRSGRASVIPLLQPTSPNPPSPCPSFIQSHVEEIDEEKKANKINLLQILSRIEQHKYAPIFSKSFNDEGKIKIPMDLSIIKKQIENGAIENMTQLERNLFLMLLNFVMSSPAENIGEMSSELSIDIKQIYEVRE